MWCVKRYKYRLIPFWVGIKRHMRRINPLKSGLDVRSDGETIVSRQILGDIKFSLKQAYCVKSNLRWASFSRS
jgi:hypothetical protein